MALVQIILALAFTFAPWAAPGPVSGPAPAPAPEEDARGAFKKGVGLFQQKQYDQAAAKLVELPELGGYLSLYKHWFLGQSYLELGKYAEAETEVAKVIQSQASTEMKYQAQFVWGEIALRQQNYADAVKRFTPLEAKWKHSYRFPEVIYRQMTAELKLNRVASACRRARKLYASFPAHVSVIGWGSDLGANEVDGKALPCKTEGTDLSERVRSLQWAGESEKAHAEISALLTKVTDADEKLRLEMIMANYMVNEGNVEDALSLLVRYYPQQKSSVPYLMLLGKAAARSGDYPTAVGAYERAFEVAPKAKLGRESLFQAAYLSYQFQDYDGAVRKFQQFAKANPKSGLARDAEWHLAWLQYLRNDFKGALVKFQAVARNGRRRRKNDNLQERLLYWMAMSHLRLDETPEAREELEQIVARNPYSYYGLAAQARLETLAPKPVDTGKRSLASKELLAKDAPKVAAADASKADEENESEEDIVQPVGQAAVAASEVKEGPDAEGDGTSIVKDPALRARIDVATKLAQLDLPELARWELWEVEKKTRNPQYLRMLISAYEQINSFHRSASIAELSFGREREVGGFTGAKDLWSDAYPMAYQPLVQKFAKQFTVNPEWTWAIMRTESLYKADVISPVGAKGLMQLMDYTARNLSRLGGVKPDEPLELLKPEVNIRLGSQYLARLGIKFKGQLPLVAAAYNAGPHRVEGWLVNFGHLETDEFVEHIPFLETRNYVKKVIRAHTFYRRLYAQDQKSVGFLAKALGVPIPSRAATRETWEAL